MSEYYAVARSDSLQHHGILGQKWGVRRFQNKDGTLTTAGKSRYSSALRAYGTSTILRDIKRDPSAKAAKVAYNAVRKSTRKDKSLTADEKKKRISASKEEWMQTKENVANELFPLNGEKLNRRLVRSGPIKTYHNERYLNSYGKLKYEKYRSEGDNPVKAKLKADAVSTRNNLTLGAMALRERNANIKEAERRRKKR